MGMEYGGARRNNQAVARYKRGLAKAGPVTVYNAEGEIIRVEQPKQMKELNSQIVRGEQKAKKPIPRRRSTSR